MSVPIFILIFLFRFVLLFFRRKIAENNQQEKSEQNAGRILSTASMYPNRRGGLHMNAGSGAGQNFTSMTICTSHLLEAYPITMPPPKRVSA